jgi:hypothetical protein
MAKEYLEEESEEEFVQKFQGKRGRNAEVEEEQLTTAEIAEASKLAIKELEVDKYALRAKEEFAKATNNRHQYEIKAKLASDKLKGPQRDIKVKEIQEKIDSIKKKQSLIKGYISSREEELFNGFLKAIADEKHSKKHRRITQEDSDDDDISVSDGECNFSIACASPDDRLTSGDRPIHSYMCIRTIMHLQGAILDGHTA